MLRRLAASVVVLALWPASLACQALGVIAGRVSARADTGAALPLAGASISIVGSTLSATSAADGRFVVPGAPSGVHTIRVRMLGYRTGDRSIQVRAGDTTRVDVVLSSSVQLLSPLLTSVRPLDAESFANRPSVATVTMSAAAMAGVPSIGEPDVARVAQLLPGVVARNDYNTGLNVRGGEADQNLVLLDGFPIYNPFHLGGLFSTFMDATVGGIELMTGAFPSRYGGRLSSVLDVHSAEETRVETHGTADLSVLAATGRLAGSFGGGRGTWSIAGRRTYADALQSIFTNNVFPYHFRDAHARVTYALPADVRLAITAYTGRDVLDANLAEFATDSTPTKASGGRWAFDWGNQLVGAVLSKELGAGAQVPLLKLSLGDSATIEQRFSTSAFSTRLDLGQGATSLKSEIRDFRLGGSLVARGAAHQGTIGYEIATHRIGYSSGSSQTGTVDFDLEQRPLTGAAFVDDLWRLSPRWLVEGGLRAEALSERGWVSLSPRMSVKFFATPDLALTVGAGRVTQTLHSLAGDGALRSFDIWLASDSFIPVATAWHWIAGAEKRVASGSVRVEGYVKRYDRVLEANLSEDPGRRGDEFLIATGLSYGVDVLARWQRASGLGGWLTYSYGRSTRTRDSLTWSPGHDRRHDLDVVATWRLARYKLGARFGFASGTPYTPIVGQIVRRQYDPSRDRWGTGDPRLALEPLGGAFNTERFPPTQRLDLDVSREMIVRGATVSPYLSVVNAYNAKNVFVYLYDYSTATPTRRAISQFPTLPSMGVRVAF